jgi:uncharacterized protein YdcH (DUF465 family)
MSEVETKEYLLNNDQEFRQLVQRHRSYEDQLQELQSRSFLNETDRFEETIIKKKKLAVKDQMQVRIQRYQTGQVQE